MEDYYTCKGLCQQFANLKINNQSFSMAKLCLKKNNDCLCKYSIALAKELANNHIWGKTALTLIGVLTMALTSYSNIMNQNENSFFYKFSEDEISENSLNRYLVLFVHGQTLDLKILKNMGQDTYE